MTMETDKIEQDINRSRSALNDTIERLGGKLSPGQIVDEVLGVAQGQFGKFTSNVGKQVRDNPIPLLLIGAGVGMYLLNQHQQQNTNTEPRIEEDDWRAEHHFRKIETLRSSSPRSADETDEAYSRRMHDEHAKALDIRQMAGEASDAFHARVKKTVDGLERRAASVRDAVSSGMSKAGHFIHDQAQHAGEMAAGAKDKAGAMYYDKPLAAGAIGVAIGALLGSFAPLSSMERDKLQGMADEAMKAGADLAERGAGAVEKATNSFVH